MKLASLTSTLVLFLTLGCDRYEPQPEDKRSEEDIGSVEGINRQTETLPPGTGEAREPVRGTGEPNVGLDRGQPATPGVEGGDAGAMPGAGLHGQQGTDLSGSTGTRGTQGTGTQGTQGGGTEERGTQTNQQSGPGTEGSPGTR